jgi:D-psicose/D-tagatose/L-ribulose 3-epimerase
VSYPIGANAWIWVCPQTDESLTQTAAHVRQLGFDVLEVAVEEPGGWDPDRLADVLATHDLGSVVVTAMGPGRDLVSGDPDVTAATQDYLRHTVDVASRIGAGVVAGPFYSTVGLTYRMDADDRRRRVSDLVGALVPVIEHAGTHGVRLALEPLNRFETSLVNTVEQALEIVDLVGDATLGLLLDTFHMNIEEKDQAAAIRSASGHIRHVHACGSDRGTPGEDHIDWPGIRDALRDTGYGGAVVIESFTGDNDVIAKAAAIWRPLAASQDALAGDGLAFLRRQLAD